MSHYASRTRRPPRTLTDDEVKRLLKVSGEHRDGFRDHVILSLALGTGLRESEIVALDVGDVTNDGRRVMRRIDLRVFKRSGGRSDRAGQFVMLPDSTYWKLEKYLRTLPTWWDFDPKRPLFLSRHDRRISTRRLRELVYLWQHQAKIAKPISFHGLRHTAISTVRRRPGAIRIAQRVARPASLNSTAIYAHVSDDEVLAAVRDMPG